MTFLPMMFAYLGPETMLPMTSVVAGAFGVVMMFGRSSMRWLVSAFRKVGSASKPIPSTGRRIGSMGVGGPAARVRG